MEMVVIAPIPGRTPIKLPTSTPKTDHIRLLGWKATPKPYHRSIRLWCMSASPLEQRHLDVQAVVEDEHAKRRHDGAKRCGRSEGVVTITHRRDEDRGKGGRH